MTDQAPQEFPSASRSPSGSAFPTVGILGGGQLGRMLALAAGPLGIRTRFYDPDDSGPVDEFAQRFVGNYQDREKLEAFARECDVITVENEWVDLSTLEAVLPEGVEILPSRRTLSWVTNKTVQKQHAHAQGLPVGRFRECASLQELREAAETFGFPMMLKRPTHSYDGYGNATVKTPEDLAPAYEKLQDEGKVLVEGWIPFRRELSVIVVRRADGQTVTYPIAHTRQENHRCVAVEVPAGVSDEVAQRAQSIARATAEAYEVVGLVAVELFELESGEVLLNEIAPRPHNSGHFSIEACATSQFENHLRAVLGWPLGDTSLVAPAAVMVNILGKRAGDASGHHLQAALEVPGASIHIYGKRAVRPNRKMGHVTALANDVDEARARAQEAAERVIL